ncbi:hypothetical protein B0I35DRAFT_513170 [Stachybotrys elegans]|uniref:SWR1-complex protein 3 domain-containing protein n=1 Tax=Stachybotrys elegans TaxID=80388 RepID=A0A8K0SS02_9HYPO|nr:hypothetical protein B0I35DRAFT_513170 [Stachybotrys elegans]
MERKRKLPARASARVEQVAKKRNITPRERSATPAAPQPAPVEETPPPPPPPPPPSLPRSIQSGKPLPVLDESQSDDLSAKDYQSINESGVLLESLSRSRYRWISDGLFEKYWTKPHKRKGVVTEDPKNPPKDSMTKVGTVSITIEPHVLEATMFVVKEAKPRPQQQNQPSAQSQVRPIIQYGPPNGSMPPPPTPSTGVATPVATTPTPTPRNMAPGPQPTSAQPLAKPQEAPAPAPAHTTASPKPAAPPATVHHVTSPATPVVQGLQAPAVQRAPSVAPVQTQPPPNTPTQGPVLAPAAAPLAARPPSNPPLKPVLAAAPGTVNTGSPLARPQAAAPSPATPTARPQAPGSAPPVARTAAPAPAPKPAANDPVIALLAQKASGDANLRDLMKRVAVGQAKEGELAHFQKIIDQLNLEYKRSGGQQGPSADRLTVDGRTVKYFADEVRTILDIVLTSNPNQRSSELRPPPRSDPLVVMLVKSALENQKTKDMIKRIAEGKPGFTDATDLKDILEKLHKDMKSAPQIVPAPSPGRPLAQNGQPNGHAKASPAQSPHANPQALRSKGPPPAPKPDVSAVVFDFGSGDRYLFPKYSILEYLPTSVGQQVIASFLIVRKGSTSEYGGDPNLDYYQPVTIRISTSTGRHLENLARAVAPQDEVRRYMDDVMDNMTRAEYILLAMRLPRGPKDGENDGANEEPKANGSSPKPVSDAEATVAPAKPTVLWATKSARSTSSPQPGKARDAEDESEVKYRRLIKAVVPSDAQVV